MVTEYWKNLPPKELIEEKLRSSLIMVSERLAEQKTLQAGCEND